MRLPFFFLILISSLGASSLKAESVALISTDSLGYEYFAVADEALTYDPSIIVFPEWGFIALQEDVSSDILVKWQNYAVTHKVAIVLNTRESGKNATFVFTKDGDRFLSYRRDGNGSPVPTVQESLVVNIEGRNVGVLVCDEARNRRYLDQLFIEYPETDLIVSPNKSGDFSGADSVLNRAIDLDYPVDIFTADTIGKFTFNGGNHTHVYRYDIQSLEVKRYLQDFPFASWDELKSTSYGAKYSIGIYEIY